MPDSFIDTNVLIYLASADVAKADRAETIVRDGGAISVQVLNEVTNVARRKMRLSWSETDELLSMLRQLLTVYDLTLEVHDLSLSLAKRYGYSVFDSMIVASALQGGMRHSLVGRYARWDAGRRSLTDHEPFSVDVAAAAVGAGWHIVLPVFSTVQSSNLNGICPEA